jgi:uncharacterized protein (TIGR03382 family)
VVDNGTDLALCGAEGLICVAGTCVAGVRDGGAAGGADADVVSTSLDAAIVSPTPDAGGQGSAGAGGAHAGPPPVAGSGCSVGRAGSIAEISGAGPVWIVAAALLGWRTRRRRRSTVTPR